MNVQAKNTQKGFTIIEVVLVLAIAGLIFLMVFIALPALQRNQRDTARKSDVGLVASAVTTYTSNNRGAFPDTNALGRALSVSEAGGQYNELSGHTTLVSVFDVSSLTAIEDGHIRVYEGRKCNTVNAEGVFTLDSGTAREFAVVTRLEGGNGTAYCQGS